MPLKLKKILPYILATTSGLLLALAYPPYDVPGLIWISLLPLFFALFSSMVVPWMNKWRSFFTGTIFGLVYLGITYLPLLETYPLGWAGITNPIFGRSLVFFIWATVTVIGALPFTLMTLAATFLKNRLSENRTLIFFPFLWVVFEYIRAYFISIALYGKGALVGPHWTTGHLGYALHNNTLLLQSADIWGVYGLSWLVVAVNVAIFYILTKYFINPHPTLRVLQGETLCALKVGWGRLDKKIFIPLLILVVIIFYGEWRIKNIETTSAALKPVNVALIQTDFRPNFIAGNEYVAITRPIIAKLVNEAIAKRADVIVLPEGSQFMTKPTADALAATDKPFIIIDNAAIQTERGITNSALFFDPAQKLVASSDKLLLVFLGEYVPYIFKLPAKLAGYGELIASFESRRGRVPGQEIKILRTAFGNIGVIICSEPLSPSIVRSLSAILTSDKQLVAANMLFNVSSEAIFHNSAIYAAQNRAVLQLRAVENRRPIAQAMNAGASFSIAATGQIATPAQTAAGNTVIYTAIAPSTMISFYDFFGDWIVLLSATVMLITVFFIRKRRA